MSDLHKPNTVLDYPMGGMGELSSTLVKAMTKNGKGTLQLNSRVERLLLSEKNGKPHCYGVVLQNGRHIHARRGVICNAPLWNTAKILQNSISDNNDDQDLKTPPSILAAVQEMTSLAKNTNYTGSFMHLHLGIPSTDLPADLECHHSVLNLSTDVTAPQNLVIISIPTVFDPSLAPEGYHIIHAYTAASENYNDWSKLETDAYTAPPSSSTSQQYSRSDAYRQLKDQKSRALWDAIETIIPDVRQRAAHSHAITLTGTPLTHRRYNSREFGTYGPAPRRGKEIWDLTGASTTFGGLFLCGDCCFP
eukprot:CAMPEP_0172482894 /NCGR_PEP_ID=MMETSP1066-20121228/9587_1 /TAXON_ID=671091 /ORGANISM="Coscinodiscus wailesii, Strain CCMP2513" /LENGTH=305 /DNA_ID=CAMNT_0013246399 /DNA_START=108 /DNA_END=1021 /DNA_ORIENTATION=+